MTDGIPSQQTMKGQLAIFTQLAAQQRAIILTLKKHGLTTDDEFKKLVQDCEKEVQTAYAHLWKLAGLLPDE